MALKSYDIPVTSAKELRQKLLESVVTGKNSVPCTELAYAKVMGENTKGASVEDLVKCMVSALTIKILVPSQGNGGPEARTYGEEVEAFGSLLLKSIKQLDKDPELLKALADRGLRKLSVIVTKWGAKGSQKVLQESVVVPVSKEDPKSKKKSAA